MTNREIKFPIPRWTNRLTALPIIIFAITATMAIGTLAILWAQRTKDTLLITTNENQLGSTAAILFDMRHKEYRQLIYDYSFWDELVAFTNKPNKEWAAQNLDSYVDTYNASATIVLNKENKIIYCSKAKAFHLNLQEATNQNIINQIKKQKVYQTFIKADNHIVEISGATIHPTADKNRLSKPSGILIACKIWDQSVLNTFEKAISGRVEFRNTPLKSDLKKAEITYNYRIIGEKNKTITYLTLSKSIKEITDTKNLTHYIAISTLILAIIATILLSLIIRQLISKPLAILGEIISKKDANKIENLKNYGTQFYYLGELMDAYIKQNKELISALAKATESDRLKSAFLANISHEIRTPLNGIIGFSQLICNTNISNEKREAFKTTIIQCCQDLLKLIHDILDISKIESGQTKPSYSRFSIADLFKEMESFYPITLNQYKKEHLSLTFSIPNPDITVWLDRCKVKQILTNIINNAIENTVKGRIEVLYKINEGSICFLVKDTGTGIPKDEQKKIFQSFTQGSRANSAHRGVGLGLAIAKGLTGVQKGTIRLKSELGKGSTFAVSFPTSIAPVEKLQIQPN